MSLNQIQKPEENEEIAIISTNFGDIKIRLFEEAAPKAVENFKTHIKDGYYDGIKFHRVIEGFMVQTGDPQGTGMGGESIWGEPFKDEFDSYYHNLRGALSMANSGPNSNGSQFFIVQSQELDKKFEKQMENLGEENGFPEEVRLAYKNMGGTPWLDFKHAVFGQVFEGMDVVDKIASLETVENDKPKEDAVMEKLEIVEYK